MPNGSARRSRLNRVAALRMPPSRLRRGLEHLCRHEVVLRMAIALGTALCLWTATEPWIPPFIYRVGDVPPNDLLARTAFEMPDEFETKRARARAMEQARYVFYHHPESVAN